MLHVGIDFGTTNSTIAFFETGQIDKTKPQTYKNTSNNTDYIPSYVAINHKKNKFLAIGSSAKSKVNDANFDVFRAFKMLLSEDCKELIQTYGKYDDNEFSPKEIAKKYLKELLSQFTKAHHKKIENIKKLTISIPEIWTASDLEGDHFEKGKLSQERINDICKEIGLPEPDLISEPIGAASYFIEEYHRKNNNRYFNGHVLVCDCGGGTIDFSLVAVKNSKSSSIAREGIGHNSNAQLGCAGVAYDEAVIKHLIDKETTTPEQKAYLDKNFSKILSEFEREKIQNTEQIDMYYKDYCDDNSFDEEVFKLSEGISVKISDLSDVFKKVIEPSLIQTLERLQKSCKSENIDYNADKGDVFKVLMVGGFSRFALVQRTVKKFFKSDFYEDIDDSRFNHAIPATEIHLAIAYGAALCAKNITQVTPLTKFDIALKTSGRPLLLMKSKLPISTYYHILEEQTQPFFLSLSSDNTVNPIDFILTRENDLPREIQVSYIHECISNPQNGQRYALALTINKNELCYLHIGKYCDNSKKMYGDIKITPLGNLLSKLKKHTKSI